MRAHEDFSSAECRRWKSGETRGAVKVATRKSPGGAQPTLAEHGQRARRGERSNTARHTPWLTYSPYPATHSSTPLTTTCNGLPFLRENRQQPHFDFAEACCVLRARRPRNELEAVDTRVTALPTRAYLSKQTVANNYSAINNCATKARRYFLIITLSRQTPP